MSTTRSRRAATAKVNYAKEQEFSDEDLFEDEELQAPVRAPAPARKKRVRKTKDNSGHLPGSFQQLESDSIYQDTRPLYTEKGYDPALPPIRERFSFMPEYEDDGTMKIELIVGRRPIDESGQENEDDESDADSNADVENDGTTRKVRSKRDKKEPLNDDSNRNKDISPDKQEAHSGSVVEYEYLVKYKGRSYLHLEWKTGADLESMNKSAKALYRRYLKKIAQGVDDDLENPEFDPSYAVPEKIVDEAEQEITIELTDKELLRWEKQREAELALEGGQNRDDEGETSLENIQTKPQINGTVLTTGDGLPVEDSTGKFNQLPV